MIDEYMRKYYGKESGSIISRLIKAVHNRQEPPIIVNDDDIPFKIM